MSVKVMQWAWEQAIGNSSRKLVLLALADRANDDGECWPGIANLTDKCSIPRRTLIRALLDLEAQGFLSVEHRAGNGTGRKTNVYQLKSDRPVDNAGQSANLAQRGKVPNQQAKCQSDTRQSANLAHRAKCQNEGAKCQSDTRQSAKKGGAKCQSLAPNTSVDTSTRKTSGEPSVCEARAPDPHTPPAPTPVPAPKSRPPAQEPLPACPDWLPAETWQAFIDHRKELKKPLTASSAAMTLKQLDKARGFGHDPATLIETAIAGNWTGCVFPERHHQPAPIHVPATPTPHNGQRYTPPTQAMTPEVAEFDAILRNLNIQSDHAVIEGECRHVAH